MRCREASHAANGAGSILELPPRGATYNNDEAAFRRGF
jgi:hypothetical protein